MDPPNSGRKRILVDELDTLQMAEKSKKKPDPLVSYLVKEYNKGLAEEKQLNDDIHLLKETEKRTAYEMELLRKMFPEPKRCDQVTQQLRPLRQERIQVNKGYKDALMKKDKVTSQNDLLRKDIRTRNNMAPKRHANSSQCSGNPGDVARLTVEIEMLKKKVEELEDHKNENVLLRVKVQELEKRKDVLEDEKEWTICSVEPKEWALPCGHVFGKSCVFLQQSLYATCPTCRAKFGRNDPVKLFLSNSLDVYVTCHYFTYPFPQTLPPQSLIHKFTTQMPTNKNIVL